MGESLARVTSVGKIIRMNRPLESPLSTILRVLVLRFVVFEIIAFHERQIVIKYVATRSLRRNKHLRQLVS